MAKISVNASRYVALLKTRNEVERASYQDFFNDYSKLMGEFQDKRTKLKRLERQYLMRGSTTMMADDSDDDLFIGNAGNERMFASMHQSMGTMSGANDKEMKKLQRDLLKLEEQIRDLKASNDKEIDEKIKI